MPADENAMAPGIERRLDELVSTFRLMIETQKIHGKMLTHLIELATPDDTESPLEAAMAEIAGALRDQTAVLERIDQTMGGIGGDVEAGVLRGLAGALGVEPAGTEGETPADCDPPC